MFLLSPLFFINNNNAASLITFCPTHLGLDHELLGNGDSNASLAKESRQSRAKGKITVERRN